MPQTRFAFALAALAFVAATAAGAQSAYTGSWKIVSAEPAPWVTKEVTPLVSEAKALLGKTIVIKASSISGPRQLACPKARFEVKDYPADMLFQGSFGEMHERDSSVDPVKVASSVGFIGASFKTIETGCGNEIDFHFIDAATMAFGLNNTIYKMKRP